MTTRNQLAVNTPARRSPARVGGSTHIVASVGAAIAVGAVLGVAAAQNAVLPLVGALVGLGALALVLVRPELVLVAWFTAILVDGRTLTYHHVGPLYVTEPLLALLVLGTLAGILVRLRTGSDILESRRRPLTFVTTLALVMLVPALAGLGLETSSFDYTAGRNLLLLLYPLFAVIVVCVTDLRNTYRYWFAAALGGSTLALLIVATGNAGGSNVTSTGAVRVAGYTFALAFGIAPIVLIAAAREGLIKPLLAAACAIPFVAGLVAVNHRSAWLAFVAGLAVLFARHISPSVLVGSLAVVIVGWIILTGPVSKSTPLGEEIARARTVTSTTDPNAEFRLSFWEAAMARSIRSPLIGNGFDMFPAEIVPPHPGNPDPFPAPHNSFVSIAYRVGFIPFLIVLAMLLTLVGKGYRASVERAESRDRAICAALTAIVVYTGVTSAFNVFLEAPYAGPLFWTCVGLLAYTVYADPFRVSAGSGTGR